MTELDLEELRSELDGVQPRQPPAASRHLSFPYASLFKHDAGADGDDRDAGGPHGNDPATAGPMNLQ